MWARWPCHGCGTLITFDRWRRFLMGLGVGLSVAVAMVTFIFVLRFFGLVAGLLSGGTVIVLSWLWFLIDGVRAVEPDPGPLCPKCRYPILATFASGVPVCPECGTAIPPHITSHPQVATLGGAPPVQTVR